MDKVKELLALISVSDRVALVKKFLDLPVDENVDVVPGKDVDSFIVKYYGSGYTANYLLCILKTRALREFLLSKIEKAREVFEDLSEGVGVEVDLDNTSLDDFYKDKIINSESETELSELFSNNLEELESFYNIHKQSFNDDVRGFLSEVIDTPFPELWDGLIEVEGGDKIRF